MNSQNGKRDGSWMTAVLLPLLVISYAISVIVSQRVPGRGSHEVVGPAAVRYGLGTLGLALALHAWYFGAYRRMPFIRWLLILLGVVVFIGGLLPW